jgi:hypothetical protein
MSFLRPRKGEGESRSRSGLRGRLRSVYERTDRQSVDDRRETKYTMDLQSGEIWPTGEPRPPRVDDLDELDWTELGGISRETGHATVDLEKARRWRPLSEFWRW